jgi:RNA polymerase sigma-70 factor (ECF subfamily)
MTPADYDSSIASELDGANAAAMSGHAASRPGNVRKQLWSGPDTESVFDTDGFQLLFKRHRQDVARLIFRMTGSSPDLEDILQEVFIEVHRNLPLCRGESEFTIWLQTVTVNVLHGRAARKGPQIVQSPAGPAQSGVHLASDEDAARLDRMRAFRRLLERLAEKKRTVFLLHELEGLSPAKIAQVMGSHVLTVRTRLFYARRELAAMLKDERPLAEFAAAFEIRGEEKVQPTE